MKPLVCMVEDDPLKRSLALSAHLEDFSTDFDLRFVVCEQQFSDALAGHVDVAKYFSPKRGEPRWAPIWDPKHAPFPALFIVDMMVCWDDKDYQSGSAQPEELAENRAGLRMGKQLCDLLQRSEFDLIFWTAIDCRDIADAIENELHGMLMYKDDVRLHQLFEHVKAKLRR
jgi:hypothetical protein